MSTFAAADPASLPGPAWLQDRRRRALEQFIASALPTEEDEIWRYSRIGALDLGAYRPPEILPRTAGVKGSASRLAGVQSVLDAIGLRAGLVITVDGHPTDLETHADAEAKGLVVGTAAAGDARDALGSIIQQTLPDDAFVTLNDAQHPDVIVVQVPANVEIDRPVVIIHWVDTEGVAVFPRTLIDAGANSRVTVIDYLISDDITAFVDPVFEVSVGDGADVGHLVVQELGPRVWQTAYHASCIGRDAHLTAFAVALGGDYSRVRTDASVLGAAGSTDLLALYFGDGNQMHDFRTLQEHVGPKSTSELVFKGAVMDEARSAYSGLIRVHRGARGTKAFQTNRNLVLSDTGLATYSVPNLDIEENEVSCSHASATGPIDPEQRFYLESRGLPPDVADRLIVMGFFGELLARLPVPALRARLMSAIADKLAGVHRRGQGV